MFPKRKHPTHGVIESQGFPVIVFLTVCTERRSPWIADSVVHRALCATWTSASAWLVGRYVLMPDHLHLFCTPGSLDIPLDNWVRYWKSQFSKLVKNAAQRWQADHWDTRMRSWEHYAEKWEYTRFNPVRKQLVARPEDWPYQGELHELW